MKRYLVPLLGTALLLSACSNGGNDPATVEAVSEEPCSPPSSAPSTPSPTADFSPSATPTPMLAPAEPTTPSPAPPATQAPAPPAPTPPSSTGTSPRGNLIKQVGELAGIRDETGEYLASFTVNSVIVDIPCTEDWADPPENGHFVALDVSVETSPNMLTSDLIQQFSMSSLTFQAIGPDGVTSNAGTDSAATLFCLDGAVELPSNIGPGEKAQGLVLLDVENPTGTLIYQDFWTDSGWEYTY